MKPFVLFGDSHAAGYRAAARDRGDDVFIGGPAGVAHDFYRRKWDVVDGMLVCDDPTANDRLSKYLQVIGEKSLVNCGRRIVVSLGLAHRAVVSSKWKLFSVRPNAQRNSTYISKGALQRTLTDFQSEVLKIYKYGIDNDLFVAAIAAPPLRANVLEDRGWDLESSKYLWRCFEEPVRQYLRERNIPVVEPPSDMLDECGLLRDEHHADHLHGNVAYGHRVLEETLKLIGLPRG
jgi:hypothetical protein